VIVPTTVPPLVTLAALVVNDVTDSGCVELIVSVASNSVPAFEAEINAVCVEPTGSVWIVKVPLVAFTGMVTVETSVTLLVGSITELLDVTRFTTSPPVGAGSVSVTVAVDDCPPFTVAGFSVIVFSTAARLLVFVLAGIELLPQPATPARTRASRP